MRIPPQGRLTLTIRSRNGELVAERHARNLVVRSGADLIARLLSGGPGATPINFVRFGFGDHATPDATVLTPPVEEIPPTALEAAIAPASFSIDGGTDGMVKVNVSVPFNPTQDISGVTEAGLFAGQTLYNQVVFDPVTLTTGQVITFYWQIDFPYGR
jgi:hypothetical protein